MLETANNHDSMRSSTNKEDHERIMQNTAITGRRTLSVEEFLAVAAIGRTNFYRRVAAGEIKTMRLGRRRFVPLAEVDRFLGTSYALETLEIAKLSY